MKSTAIVNGLIVDGTGTTPPYYGSVVFCGDKITHVWTCPDPQADVVVDAQGLVVCPGFIDTHSHSGLKALNNNMFPEKITQGITTELLGQDGVSVVPLKPTDRAVFQEYVGEVEGDFWGYDFTCATTDSYLTRLAQSKPLTNYAWLVPHGNVRMAVMGNSSATATSAEIAQMCRLLDEELAAGAFGMSAGLIYAPGCYADEHELAALCKVVAARGGIFAVHQRSESDTIISSMHELIRIAKASGVWLHVSHFKICGQKNQKLLPEITHIVQRAVDDGIRLSFDQYPYTAGSTALSMLLPPWTREGGVPLMLERLGNAAMRKKMIADIIGEPGQVFDWDNFYDFAGPDGIYLTSGQRFVGNNLKQIAAALKVSPLEAAFEIIMENHGQVGMVNHYGTEETLISLLCMNEQNICTDGVPGAMPHPRTYGTTARFLGHYVRDKGIMPLEKGIYKLSGKAASVLGLHDRGLLKVGAYADIVLLDLPAVKDTADFTAPTHISEGFVRVYVNGVLTVENGKLSGSAGGRVIRK